MSLINISLSPKVLAALCLMVAAMTITNAQIDINNININDIPSQLPAELSNTTLDDAKALLKNKCIEVAGKEKGEDAYQAIESATIRFGECVSNIVNYTVMQEEINEASPRGELDVVFGKYCLKRPQALECIESFNVKLLPCLEKEERDNQDVIMRIVRSLLNFICHNGGDQIALFIAEKGPECLKSKQDDIQHCINNTFSGYVPNEGIDNMKSLPKFVMGPKQCDEMEDLEACIISKLDTCEEITPANIVESMFRFIKNETICGSRSRVNGAMMTTTMITPLLGIGIAELSNTTLDDAKALLKNKCIEVAGKEKGEDAYQAIESATIRFGECVSNIVNYTVMQEEINEASPRGELDVVFGKYCLKRPQALECIESFNVKLLPCLEKEERDNQDVIMRIVRSLLNFICHKGGDQIALFIAEKGPECLKSKQDDIQHCINNTFSGYVPNEGIDNMKSLPKFVMGPKQCDEMEDLEACIISKLDTCEEITPANIVESMFRFIKNETICGSRSRVNGAMMTTTMITPLLGIGIIFYYITKWMQQS